MRFFNFSLNGERDFYFGSLAAAYDYFVPEEMGVGIETLYGKLKHGDEYVTRTCIIKKGNLIRKGKTKKPKA